ncbi:deoxyribodipyrimidine photo-lyase [Chryseobacterium sp. Ch-15]|uniref:Deoxyribodipyrimidine photo-lyase n=1 Tax=Chryseobacterium muglaense TaxID=2893752 RepID=A0A9Q3YSK7_9FLAO|nr:FAD-binding domain-containing protein [Chryseobacterium muglaense]MBD3903296.1 deoxyribodipyrimidine photo-lyase [Chryseobacterium muglaense]MCC9036126.1 deoxyribodipyrimidine photo-lyase [Chryseobacterium muglaense]MCM2553298.1 deoxyribodipyrimidine photo-lyase [Chryseobacterium muglaense]
MKKEVTVFWFKRDLRIEDNEALIEAISLGKPILFVYFLEPSLLVDPHYSLRHFQFIKESLADLNRQFDQLSTSVLCIQEEVVDGLKKILDCFTVTHLVSTQEIGLAFTFKRDREVSAFCPENNIEWLQPQYNGILRGLKDRRNWVKNWKEYVVRPIVQPDFRNLFTISKQDFEAIESRFETFSTKTNAHHFQRGGRTEAEKWVKSFFTERVDLFAEGVSSPLLSRTACSRLSPYIAWGNVSIREIYKQSELIKSEDRAKKGIKIFVARLRLQSYFIQKFESQHDMEFRAAVPAFRELNQPKNSHFIDAWKAGKTGYPLVDASIRCIVETGYLNFRMRSLIISFYAHHLFQHFRHISAWLAQTFLDFEPGIHYGQLQMQSGFTANDVLRIYNPTKNAYEHDKDAEFIKMWLPELKDLPAKLAIEPWLLTPMDEIFYNFKLGDDYPKPIVDIEITRAIAMEKLFAPRKKSN